MREPLRCCCASETGPTDNSVDVYWLVAAVTQWTQTQTQERRYITSCLFFFFFLNSAWRNRDIMRLTLSHCSCADMWRCTWFHWTPAGPERFTAVRRWSRRPRWVSTKASAFLSLQTPWRCALCSCPCARWDLRPKRSCWWVSRERYRSL